MKASTSRLRAAVLAAIVAAALVPAALSGGQNTSDVVTAGRILRLESKILGEAREVWLRLPPGYDQSVDRYPVLIQLGARMHFATRRPGSRLS